MSADPRDYAAAIRALLQGASERIGEALVGIDALANLPPATSGAAPASIASLPNEKPLFDAVRQIKGKDLTQRDVDVIHGALLSAFAPAPAASGAPQTGLSDSDFAAAAQRLGGSKPQIKAVWDVEANGSGWFTDVRADILALDGPGGFIADGTLPKILFEAHIFSRLTGHRFDRSHPDISSPKWSRSLYKGGQAEWGRLWKAMQLDRRAALMAASWGGPQILGENYKLAGFSSVEAFVDAMMGSERAHLEAFCSFVMNSGLGDEFRRISGKASDCAPFAEGYNGSGYKANGYDTKIAAAFRKESGS